jgi:hypothetical protein
MSAEILALCGWERFQHYKDRDPPWVKLYRDLLTSESWVLGTDASRLLQLASVLLAARYSNKIPYQYDMLRRVATLDMSEKVFIQAVKHLQATNFLEIQRCPNGVEVLAQSASTTLAPCTSEAEAEQSKEEDRGREDKISVELKLDRGKVVPLETPVERVFAHWRQVHNHPRAHLDARRRKLIENGLRGYSEADLCESIAGYRNSSHHMGSNDRNTVYDDIEIFLRDAKHIENGLRFAREPPSAPVSSLTRRNLEATAGWMPPEMRNAAK